MDLLSKKKLSDINFKDKKVIVRLDLNVPLKNGVITDDKRIVSSLPTIQYLLDNNCKIIILSHLGRVETLEDIGKRSLAPIAKKLQDLLLNTNVKFINDSVGESVINAANNLNNKEILLLENTRYNDIDSSGNLIKKESKCDNELGKFWASLADVFVNDAFGTSHRKHASNVGIAKNIKESCIGFLIEKELENLSKVTQNIERPFAAILGGSKISDKTKVVNNLLNIADSVLIGGGMAYTFLKSEGIDIGKSLREDTMIDEVKKIMAASKNKLFITKDSNCANSFADVTPIYRTNEEGYDGLMALDIGKDTVKEFENVLSKAKTIFWNGPMGVSEFKNFEYGTRKVMEILKKCTQNGAYTLIGGGDSASAVVNLGFDESDFSFISTGGGASLELIEGKELPGIACIEDK